MFVWKRFLQYVQSKESWSIPDDECTIPRNSSSPIVLRIFQGYRDDECATGLLTQQLFYAFARCSNTLLSEQFLTYHCNFPQLYFVYAIVMTHVGPNV
jgi:hypothetical protein